MKKIFKKALSIVLSLALTIMCLTGAFVSASAETTTTTSEKMLKITPQVAGDTVSFRQQTLTQGHIYKLKMLQKGITGVIPFSTDWNNYTNTPAVVGTEGYYTTYTFTCVYPRTRLLFTTAAAGTSGYMADIKLYDTTNSTDTGIDFTTMTFEYKTDGQNTDTYSNWLTQNPNTNYSSDILNTDIAGINFIELLDFDTTVFEPEKMLKITPQDAAYPVSFRQQELAAGHTYKLKMLQKGITGVIPRERVNGNYVNTPAVAGTESDYTTYTFTCAGDRTRFLFTTDATGTSGYMADIKLYDTTSGTEVNIDFTVMTFEYNGETYSNWLYDRAVPEAFTPDFKNAAIADINFVELLDFDATVFGPPEKMLEITPRAAGLAVSFRQRNLEVGHTYKLKMLQKGITGVIPFSTDWSTYINTPAVAGTEGDYTTYTFTCAISRTRLLFTTAAAGTSGYMADIKLYDTTNSTDTGIDFTEMTLVADKTYSNWLVDNPNITAYSEDITNAAIADINFVELLDYDPAAFGTVGFKSHSLVLTDAIGVNFFLNLKGLSVSERAESYVTFEISKGEGDPVNGKTANYNRGFTGNGGTHGFTCYLSSVQMAETITPTLHYTCNDVEFTLTDTGYSVKEYIDYVDENSEDENLKGLAKAIGDYGHYAQIYLGAKNNWTADTDYTVMPRYRGTEYGADDYSSILSQISGKALSYEGIANGSGSGQFQYTLNFDTTTSIKMQFNTQNVSFKTITRGGENFADRKNDYPGNADICTLYLLHIPIAYLGDTITINGTANGDDFTIALSGISYVQGLLNRYSGSSTASAIRAKNMVSALYTYYEYANEFAGGSPVEIALNGAWI